jgi:hypothetical protein
LSIALNNDTHGYTEMKFAARAIVGFPLLPAHAWERSVPLWALTAKALQAWFRIILALFAPTN